ncbi:hypothetical protein ACVRXQ_10410 [Streptococcus panodentis]|uniref:Ethanolamine utilization cobalamin adenosyltransferase n=1 Tax=Streptococcus panodentis TaxID=1581472 RepID=A0ABS5AXM3_9STRE|nr:hypothetical protein [Streptococcus panodentis]MBP2621323.1 hypothetical protein [Streptococcus panodentis]
MSVFTEAKIRKLRREGALADKGIFELENNEKLTPAARGFLKDHHIQIVYSNQPKKATSADDGIRMPITRLEDSAVYPRLFKLTKLYTYFLKNQRELHLAFQDEKCEQMGLLLSVLENMVGQRILDDISDYQADLASHADLQAVRVSKQLDQEAVMMNYDAPLWQLTCYESYIETSLLRKELEQELAADRDVFASKVTQLLKSIEVLLWLIAS